MHGEFPIAGHAAVYIIGYYYTDIYMPAAILATLYIIIGFVFTPVITLYTIT